LARGKWNHGKDQINSKPNLRNSTDDAKTIETKDSHVVKDEHIVKTINELIVAMKILEIVKVMREVHHDEYFKRNKLMRAIPKVKSEAIRSYLTTLRRNGVLKSLGDPEQTHEDQGVYRLTEEGEVKLKHKLKEIVKVVEEFRKAVGVD